MTTEYAVKTLNANAHMDLLEKTVVKLSVLQSVIKKKGKEYAKTINVFAILILKGQRAKLGNAQIIVIHLTELALIQNVIVTQLDQGLTAQSKLAQVIVITTVNACKVPAYVNQDFRVRIVEHSRAKIIVVLMENAIYLLINAIATMGILVTTVQKKLVLITTVKMSFMVYAKMVYVYAIQDMEIRIAPSRNAKMTVIKKDIALTVVVNV